MDYKKTLHPNNDSPYVSVIVPVYNTKKYLTQCLKSLTQQTLDNIEIIIIDDGSTDGSGDLCDEFALIDSRIKVMHKQNEGLSAARNDGIKNASAKYVMFVDSDDWVEPDFCRSPYQIAKDSDVDMVVYNYFLFRIIRSRKRRFPVSGLISREIALTKYLPYVEIYTWNKLYRKSLFQNIQYPVGRLCEDSAITHQIINKSNNIYLSNEYLYTHRRSRPGSISNDKSKQYIQDAFFYGFKRVNDLKRWGYDIKDEEMRIAILYLMVCGRSNKFSKMCEKIISEKHCFSGTISWKYKIMLHVFRASPRIFEMISIISKMRKKGYID